MVALGSAMIARPAQRQCDPVPKLCVAEIVDPPVPCDRQCRWLAEPGPFRPIEHGLERGKIEKIRAVKILVRVGIDQEASEALPVLPGEAQYVVPMLCAERGCSQPGRRQQTTWPCNATARCGIIYAVNRTVHESGLHRDLRQPSRIGSHVYFAAESRMSDPFQGKRKVNRRILADRSQTPTGNIQRYSHECGIEALMVHAAEVRLVKTVRGRQRKPMTMTARLQKPIFRKPGPA